MKRSIILGVFFFKWKEWINEKKFKIDSPLNFLKVI